LRYWLDNLARVAVLQRAGQDHDGLIDDIAAYIEVGSGRAAAGPHQGEAATPRAGEADCLDPRIPDHFLAALDASRAWWGVARPEACSVPAVARFVVAGPEPSPGRGGGPSDVLLDQSWPVPDNAGHRRGRRCDARHTPAA
jgi:hypothetical protein